MNRPVLLATLLTATALHAPAYAVQVSNVYYGLNIQQTDFINSPTSSHVMNVKNASTISLNLSQVSDTNGQNNKFWSKFGMDPEDSSKITSNKIYGTAMNSKNGNFTTSIGQNSARNIVRYNLNNADATQGRVTTNIFGYGTATAANDNEVNLKLNGDVRNTYIYTTIGWYQPGADLTSNKVYNDVTNSTKSSITTLIHNGKTQSPVSNNISAVLNNTKNSGVHTEINGGASGNTIYISDTIGQFNDFTTNLGGSLDSNSTNMADNSVFAVAYNGSFNTVDTPIRSNSTSNYILASLTGTSNNVISNDLGSSSKLGVNNNTITNTIGRVGQSTKDNFVTTRLEDGSEANHISNTVFGSNNQIFALLRSDAGLPIKGNIITVYMIGDYNNANTQINGNGNNLTIRQESPGLLAADRGNNTQTIIEGNLNTGNVHMIGKNNRTKLTFDGSNNSGSIHQVGNGNYATLSLEGNNLSYTLTQNGNGLNAWVIRK